MFTQIKTSKKNREVVTILSRKFNLGAENVIARIAFAYSLSKGKKLSLSDIQDSQGKEYSKSVLFGNNYPFYLGLVCVHYGLYKTDKDITVADKELPKAGKIKIISVSILLLGICAVINIKLKKYRDIK